MKYKFISDSHTHSENSFDGNDSVIMMCERAANLGLYSVTVTDHCECNEYYENEENVNYRKCIEDSIRDTAKARAMYISKVNIYTGIELGQPCQDRKAAEEVLSLAEYDFVLGSLHNLRGEKDFYFLEYTKENVPELLERYFRELLELVEENNFDSLAHLTYPMRYIAANPEITTDMSCFKDELDEILKKLGGKYVTVGSDAHRWGDVGSGIEDGLQLLLKCGYTHFTVYEKRKPKLLPIL